MTDEITEPTVHLCWNDFAIRGAVQVLRAAHLELMADDMESHLKPAIEEPKEFGSVVMAGVDGLSDRVHWVRCGGFWFTPGMSRAGFEDLHHPEVLRVGIGEPPEAEYHRGYEIGYGEGVNWGLAAGVKPVPTDADEFMTSAGFDSTPAQEAAYLRGAEVFAAKVRREVSALRAAAIGAERKDAYDTALALVGALLGES